MSDALLIGVATMLSALIATGASYLLAMWVNKRKLPVDLDEIKARTGLTTGELLEKYQAIAGKQADENIELSKQKEELLKERVELRTEVDTLKKDVEELKKARIADREEFRKAFEEERIRSEKILQEERVKSVNIVDYNSRLEYQLKSWGIQPIPYDVETAKLEMKQDFINGHDFDKSSI
jgi:FKBP-type peptidyl-prolyl cis-trans isomerase